MQPVVKQMVADVSVDVRIQVPNATLLLHPPSVRKRETRKCHVKWMIMLHLLNGLKKVSVEPSNPKPRPQEKPTFIGGFSPFTPPTPAAREAFLKIMAEAK